MCEKTAEEIELEAATRNVRSFIERRGATDAPVHGEAPVIIPPVGGQATESENE
jgi:hypothetical protein